MASIRERLRGDGSVAYLVVYKLDGRQGGLTFDSLKTANAFKTAVEVHGARRALEMYDIDPTPRRRDPATELTVGEWVKRHIDNLTGVEQYTIDQYTRYLEQDIKPTLGDIPLSALTEEDIAAWVKRMETTPSAKTGRLVSPKTIKNKHGFLSGALAAAVPKYIGSNPAAGRRLPRKTGDSEDEGIRSLSRDEWDCLLAATPDPWKPLLEFLVASGCRWGEATALKPSDIDMAAGTVKIRRAWKYSSKGYTIGPPKTKRSRRTINIPKAVLDKLDNLDNSSEWLFTNPTTGRPVRYHGFKPNVWDKAVTKAKLEPKPTPHDLRHTCATWMLAEGVPITTVSRHLGHENIAITVDTYADTDRASHAAAADVMARLLGN